MTKGKQELIKVEKTVIEYRAPRAGWYGSRYVEKGGLVMMTEKQARYEGVAPAVKEGSAKK